MTGKFKHVYQLVALLALANLLVLAGGIGYLVSTGKLTGETVEQIAAVLRGEMTKPKEVEAEAPEQVIPPNKATDTMQQDQQAEEIERYMSDRRRAELWQQSQTISRARLDVIRDRDALQRRADEIDAQLRQQQEREESAGFKREMDLLSSIKPKEALYHLLQKQKEDAANVLLKMDRRKAKKIVESAKTPAQKKAINEILELLGQMRPDENGLLPSKKSR